MESTEIAELCFLGRDQDEALPKTTHSPHCMGCNRPGHMLFKTHQDFNQGWVQSRSGAASQGQEEPLSTEFYFSWTEGNKTILEKLKTKPEFSDLEIQPIALQNHFKRMQKDDMAREVFDKKVVRKENKKKQKEKEAEMSITEMALAQQGSSSIIKKEVLFQRLKRS